MAKQAAAMKKVAFELVAPTANSVALAGDFTGWDARPINLTKQKGGAWKATVRLKPGTYEYRFIVDGQWTDDPQCATRVPNVYGSENCVRAIS